MLVSICIPTYKRHDLLVRSVASAIGQTYREIEVIISNDDNEDTQIEALMRQSFPDEDRIRVVHNLGGQGQISNTNNVLLAASGEWIKILHDDDVLKSHCIETLVNIARSFPDARSIPCRSDRYFEDELVFKFERGNRPYLERIEPSDVPIASYLMADTGGGLPSEQFIHSSIIERGILLEQVGTMYTMVDSCWNIRVKSSGDFLILNEALVLWCQGKHDTQSSIVDRGDLDQEFIDFRAYAFGHIAEKGAVPSLSTVQNYVRLVRAAWRLKKGDPTGAFRLVMKGLRFGSILLLLKYGLQSLDDLAGIKRSAVASRPEDVFAPTGV